MSAAVQLPVRSEDVVRCARCGHGIAADAWRRLPRVRTLSRTDLATHVHSWPPDVVVEVRACPSCATPIARRARA
jgi:hypothetical protein